MVIGIIAVIISVLFLYLFRGFLKLIPGKTYASKIFYWDFIRTILVYIQIFFFLFLIFPSTQIFNRITAQVADTKSNIASENDVVIFLNWNAVNEFLTTDTFAWDDILFIFVHKTPNLRWILGYLVFIPLFLLIDYRWVKKHSSFAKLIRTLSWFLVIFLMLLGMVSTNANYDVYVDTQLLTHWNWASWLLLLSIIQLSTMWLGALITGYLIFKSWKEDKK